MEHESYLQLSTYLYTTPFPFSHAVRREGVVLFSLLRVESLSDMVFINENHL